MVMSMRVLQSQNIYEKVKDCIVDGCLLYDGVLVLLGLGMVLSLVLSYSAVMFT
jgi:hypothetical protein